LNQGRFRDAQGEEYDINFKARGYEQKSLASLDDVYVQSQSGAKIPLKQISTPSFVSAPSEIQRHDRVRQATVTAYPQTGFNTEKVTLDIAKKVAALKLPKGFTYKVAGQLEARQKSFSGIGPAILVAVFGILAVLILEFGSFKSTLIVAGVIPLGIVGAFMALWATGYNISFTAVVGIIALIGIEIKNSILLVDFTNQLREGGASLDEAIEQAGEIRFLPILLTSATAVGGLLPLAAQGSGLYSPLAITIIGGLISSTLLARLVTPVMYKLLPPDIMRKP
jgi:multidrug efflux pump subunit AcrB